MKRIIQTTLFLLAVLTSLTGCKHRNAPALLPNVSGKAGEIVVVIEREPWEGNTGAELRTILASDTPYLAQREPLFKLTNVPPGNFNNMFKMHRNILLVNINPQLQKTGAVYKSDEWAHPQAVAQINSYDEEGAIELIKENAVVLQEYFEQAERDRIIANSRRYEELGLRPFVEELTGGDMNFPSGFKLKKRTSDFLWIADVKQYVNQHVLLYKYPATGTDADFDPDNLLANMNRVMKDNVPGMMDNSWMITSTAIDPTFESLSYKGLKFMRVRGFWEVHNDYMGGPMVAHAFYSKDGKDILVLEAFVYAPRYDKRQYLRQVESLLYSFEWKKDDSEAK